MEVTRTVGLFFGGKNKKRYNKKSKKSKRYIKKIKKHVIKNKNG